MTRFQQFSEQGSGSDHLLKVIEYQQEVLVLQGRFQENLERLASHFSECQGLSNGEENLIGVAQRCKVHKIDTIRVALKQISRYLKSQTRLANASRTCNGQ